jgi:RNA polymerase sigma-70 factor (ECF subfamily)
VNNLPDAEDIMQEAFLKAFMNLDRYKGEVSFGAWLKKIVVNQSLDYLRKRKVEIIPLDENIEIIEDDKLESSWEIDRSIQYEKVIKEISNLPEGYRIILSLYLLEGYDHSEIAEILNISPSTSRSQFNRAKKRLLENLNKKKDKNDKT